MLVTPKHTFLHTVLLQELHSIFSSAAIFSKQLSACFLLIIHLWVVCSKYRRLVNIIIQVVQYLRNPGETFPPAFTTSARRCLICFACTVTMTERRTVAPCSRDRFSMLYIFLHADCVSNQAKLSRRLLLESGPCLLNENW